MKIVYMGTPQLSARTLQALHNAGHQISLVLTQPDRPSGRGQQLHASPVKEMATSLGIPVESPLDLKGASIQEKLKSQNADFFVVVAYGRILPVEILNMPKACLNVHYSLLPKHRGAAPVHYALMNGDKKTGVTIIKMDEGMDSGDVLLSAAIDIHADENRGALEKRLEKMGEQLMLEVLSTYDKLTPTPQNHDEATYAPKIIKEASNIIWDKTAEVISWKFRALTPGPSLYSFLRGERIKFTQLAFQDEASLTPNQLEGAPGEIISIADDVLLVRCGSGAIRLIEIQPESRSAMSVSDFIHGHHIKLGEAFSSDQPSQNT